MAFQSVPNTVQLAVIYSQNSQFMQNTFYARFAGTYSQSDLDALAANVDTTVAAEWLPLQTLDCSYLRTEAKGLEFENDLVAQSSAGTGSGGDALEGLPNSVTIAIKKGSGLTGRSARGRNYWMGMPANKLQANENLVTTAYTALIETALDKVRQAINASFQFQAVLVSRRSNGTQRAIGVTFDWISTSCVNVFVDTQRGRLTT